MLDAVHNPFQVLTFIVAPAILTNASSVLTLGTSNRFARAVDRTRSLIALLKGDQQQSLEERAFSVRQLQTAGRRTLMVVKALTCFYFAVGMFAATTLVSVLGSVLSYFASSTLAGAAVVVALALGGLGVIGLVAGASFLVREMWFALFILKDEIQFSQALYSEF